MSEAEKVLNNLADRVDSIQIDEFDFESWQNHIVTQRFFAEIELQYLECQMKHRENLPLTMDQAAINAIHENSLKKFLSDLLNWQPKEIKDDESEAVNLLAGDESNEH